MTAVGEVLLGGAIAAVRHRIEPADPAAVTAYHRLRDEVFVGEQQLFAGNDLDWRDEDPRTVVLVARDHEGAVLGGVRLGPATPAEDVGWWVGGRLVVRSGDRRMLGVGAALVNAARAYAEGAGVLRFEATVQKQNVRMFSRLGWVQVRETVVAGTRHMLMRWPVDRIAALVAATKRELGALLDGISPGGNGFVGDDGAPVPGSDLVACCDAITPSMVERAPEWAGWCSVLVNANDLSAMGAAPVGLLDAVGARDASFAHRVLSGLRRAATAYGIPILGGHTQFGAPASLAVTALGRAERPIPSGGGQPGRKVRLTVDITGGWRPGYAGRQWDSTTHRSGDELRTMLASVRKGQPDAAKDVSMAGIAGTLGMMAEASGCAAVLDVAAVPRPRDATIGDWLTCFPGFAMLTVGDIPVGPAVSAECGELTAGSGVRLRWPDGELTDVITGPVTRLGTA
jgi:putative N-acetyltransferase (TIGR04045 family)